MLKRALQLVIPAVLIGASACSDTANPYISDTTDALATLPPAGMTISNPHIVASLSGNRSGTSAALSAGDSVVFVSLEPGTFPTATGVFVRNIRTQDVVHATIVNGGFDPVAIEGDAGDVLEMTLERPEDPHVIYVKVPPRKPPNVVRTRPGKGRIDVALNTVIEIVFSEPVDPRTLTSSSIRLIRGSVDVAGQMEVAENGWSLQFHPNEGLLGGTPYELAITSDVRDADGDRLETSYLIDFRTTGCAGYAIPSDCPPIPTGGTSIVSGVVREWTSSGLKPVADALVFGWVQTSTFGYATGGVLTDAQGRFVHQSLPNQKLELYVFRNDVTQPCGVLIDVTGNNDPVDLEVVSRDNPIMQATAPLPRISGTVYEMVGGVRIPISGAWIVFEPFDDLVAASIYSNVAGQYALCRLHSFGFGQIIGAYKEGYELGYTVMNVLPGSDTKFDIELKRQK
jgi:hypothetical protein